MAWNDLGVIFKVNNLLPWAVSHCYVPTAITIGDRIRIYTAFWDGNSYGRLGYVDVSYQDPQNIIDFSLSPIMEDATNDAFDSDGVTPLSVISVADELRLYYAGWKKYPREDFRYKIFTGLAINRWPDTKFTRALDHYVLGPRNKNDLLRTGCMIIYEDNLWRNWFASYAKSIVINGQSTPAYNLCLSTSDDGINWGEEQIIFPLVDGSIMGYGRSAIWKEDNLYHGLFPVRGWSGKYTDIYYSTSKDGIKWQQLSVQGMAFKASDTCDGQSNVCFPSIIQQNNRILMFYNGNNFGREGLRLAIWHHEKRF